METSGPPASPLDRFLSVQPALILDGGLATELEALGCDLRDDLWSAKVLLERPELIRRVHLEYLRAGADCVVTASYQATYQGFARHGLADGESTRLLERSVALALEACDLFWADDGRDPTRQRPLVAASIGPYGAFLADGSEFRGDYDLDETGLERFHRRRWQVLADSGADLMACETLPSRAEARALRRLLEKTPDRLAWFSFSCADHRCLSEGTPIREVAEELDDCPQIVALGVNCTSPRYIASLIDEISAGSDKPQVIYPNSGEGWDAGRRRWLPRHPSASAWPSAAPAWRSAGARLLGGCCRTTPADIAELRRLCLPREP